MTLEPERNAMFRRSLTLSLVAFALAALPGPPATAAAPPQRRAARLDLTPQSFAALHALVRPHDDEWRHLKVEWLTDVVAARKRAAAEDKPLVICYTGGAGYNEPLGVC